MQHDVGAVLVKARLGVALDDHVAREQQLAAIEREQRKAATTEELLRSWETAEHVNNITRLKEMGADAMLSYARDAIPSDDVLRRAQALPPTRQLATYNAFYGWISCPAAEPPWAPRARSLARARTTPPSSAPISLSRSV